ncbi:16207_t:CDS:1, partial [Funneliformis geosporum]
LHQHLCCSICGKYFLTLKFISDHKHSVHSRRHNKKSKSYANETEMSCVLIPFNLNFNVAEDIVQSK